MKKILIIGAKGMLGQELAKAFKRDKDFEVFAWDKEELEITNQKEINKKITELAPEFIINAAAYNAVDEAESEKGFTMAKKINGLAPGYLAKVAKKIGAVLVHYSTDYVFSGEFEKLLSQEPMGCTHSCGSCNLHQNQKIGYKEDSKPNPISNYGKSKLMGEKAVMGVMGKYYIIRLSKLFGKPAISEGAKKSFFEVMLKLGKEKNEVHPVKSPPSGDAKGVFNGVKGVDEEISCFTYAPDLAKKTKEILDSKKPFGIYHVVNSGPCTWYDAACELYKQAKIKTKIIPVSTSEFPPRAAKRPAFSVLLNTKLNPMRDWKDALKDYLKK